MDLSKDDIVVLADEKSKKLKVFCALCGHIYRDPHITSCGHTFCRECVTGGAHRLCPVDNVQLSLLVKNLAIVEEVGGIVIHCRYGCRPVEGCPGEYEVDPKGCPATIKISKRLEHESECDFGLEQCPNNPDCGQMLRRDLRDHLRTCQYLRCPHYKYSCSFQGTPEKVQEHIQMCKFEGVKGVLHRMEEEIARLSQDLRQKEDTLAAMQSSLADLTHRMDSMERDSQKLEHLEEQQADIRKEVKQALSSVALSVSELKYVQQQLGASSDGTFDGLPQPQHLFKCQGTFVGHKGPVWALCKRRDSLFSASSDNSIKVWDLSATYAGPRTVTGHDGIVLALCSHGDYLFSGSSDQTIKTWGVKSLDLQASIQAHEDPVCTLACNETLLFSGSLRSIKVWDIHSYKLIRELPSQNHWVRALVASGKFLYSGSYQAVKIWSIDTLEVVHVLQCTGGSVYSLAITNKHIVCGTYENLIHVWNVHTLQELGTLRGHVGTVYDLSVLKAPGQMRLFSASYDKTIRVWNLELMTCSQTLARHEGSVTCLLVSGGTIFSGAVDSTIKAWQ